MTTAQPQPPAVMDTRDMQLVLVRAQGGDFAALPALRSMLDSRPELWQQVGDLAQHAEMVMLRLVSGDNLHVQEAVRRKLAALKEELQGPSPTPVERLLVERVGVCWLQVHQLDLQASCGVAATPSPQGLQAQKRLDSAHRRYLLAIKQLATVRKLLRPDLPAIQIGTYLAGAQKPARGRQPKLPAGSLKQDAMESTACPTATMNTED